jgi:phenylalanyl-tRNA synthetase beta chain
VTEASEVDDALVHLKVTPNRPDWLSVIGIAREVAAVLGLQLVLPGAELPAPCTECEAFPAEIEDPALCSRYTCVRLSGLEVSRSPAWLHSRLLSIGAKPINNIVDITNFVLHEWGYPLHAFDRERLRDRIVVRQMRPGETVQVLTGRTVEAGARTLAIADAQRPVALAGIMGGRDSAISATTTDVVLEAAHFEPTNIRHTARKLELSTDASYRFERGMDPNETLDRARNRAASLMASLGRAKAISSLSDAHPGIVKRRVFSLSTARVSSYLGVSVTREKIYDALVKLEYHCSEDLERIEAPTRRVDANDPVVLIEDVGRVIGFDEIPTDPSPELPSRAEGTTLDDLRATIRHFLVGHGYLEIRGYPLQPATAAAAFSQFDEPPIPLVNPKVPEESHLRQSLVPSLLSAAEENARRNAQTFRYFEIDKVFFNGPEGPRERWLVGLLAGGLREEHAWSDRRALNFYDLKGAIEELLEILRHSGARFKIADHPAYAKGHFARIFLDEVSIGAIGQLPDETSRSRNIQAALFAGELFLEPLVDVTVPRPTYKPVPRYQASFRDLSIVVNKAVQYSDIVDRIRHAAGPSLESISCIDVFEGKSIPPGHRSITISLVFRSEKGTLKATDINEIVERVTVDLGRAYEAKLRG